MYKNRINALGVSCILFFLIVQLITVSAHLTQNDIYPLAADGQGFTNIDKVKAADDVGAETTLHGYIYALGFHEGIDEYDTIDVFRINLDYRIAKRSPYTPVDYRVGISTNGGMTIDWSESRKIQIGGSVYQNFNYEQIYSTPRLVTDIDYIYVKLEVLGYENEQDPEKGLKIDYFRIDIDYSGYASTPDRDFSTAAFLANWDFETGTSDWTISKGILTRSSFDPVHDNYVMNHYDSGYLYSTYTLKANLQNVQKLNNREFSFSIYLKNRYPSYGFRAKAFIKITNPTTHDTYSHEVDLTSNSRYFHLKANVPAFDNIASVQVGLKIYPKSTSQGQIGLAVDYARITIGDSSSTTNSQYDSSLTASVTIKDVGNYQSDRLAEIQVTAGVSNHYYKHTFALLPFIGLVNFYYYSGLDKITVQVEELQPGEMNDLEYYSWTIFATGVNDQASLTLDSLTVGELSSISSDVASMVINFIPYIGDIHEIISDLGSIANTLIAGRPTVSGSSMTAYGGDPADVVFNIKGQAGIQGAVTVDDCVFSTGLSVRYWDTPGTLGLSIKVTAQITIYYFVVGSYSTSDWIPLTTFYLSRFFDVYLWR